MVTILSASFSNLSMTASEPPQVPPEDTSSNDAPPAPSSQSLVDNFNNQHLSQAVPFLPNRAQSPEEHLAIVLSMAKPTRAESKIEPSTDRRCGSPMMSGGFIHAARNANKKSQPTADKVVAVGLRQDTREELLKRLSKPGNMASKQSPEMQAAFAKRLEELLFKTAKSVEAYADSKTLDRRLQALMAAMQKRKARKSEPSASAAAAAASKQRRSSTSSGRSLQEQRKREVLLRLLGQAKMTRVFSMIAEIKLIQLGREVTAGKPYAPVPMCTKIGGCSFSVPCQGDQKAPSVVRDIFFNTAIVAAYEKNSAERLSTLPWDSLLAQGEARLAAYHTWYQQRQARVKKPEGFRTI